MKKVNYFSILLPLLLIVALVVSLVLVERNQEMRKGAYFAGTKILVTPNSFDTRVGEDVLVPVFVETDLVTGGAEGVRAKVDFVKVKMCYGSRLAIEEASARDKIDINKEAFDTLLNVKVEQPQILVEGAENCLTFDVKAERPTEELKSGMVRVATVKLSAKVEGEGKISILAEKSLVSGSNPNIGSQDMSMKIGEVTGATYTVGTASSTGCASNNECKWCGTVCTRDLGQNCIMVAPPANKECRCMEGGCQAVDTTVPQGETPVLNFKISFQGVTASSKCAVNWPLQITVLAGGVNKVYPNVVAIRDVNITDKAVYIGTVSLAGFTHKKDIAVFFKGPKHIQTKYGVDNQKAFYNIAGGQIDLSDPMKVYDFSNYPLLAGDVTGDVKEVQDGVIDGRDFSYIKAEVEKRTEVAEGSNMLADINGNCKLESQDITFMMLSLKDKQEQLY